MLKRILIGVAVLVVAALVYAGYSSYDAGRSANGEVYSNDPPSARRARTEMSVVPAERTSERAAEPVKPMAATPQTAAAAAGTTADGMLQTAPGQTTQTGGLVPPASDTISPNPPNGMVFAGTGRYQVYRQGNITWRLDTNTGQSCVLFATNAEWRKPQVYRYGCRGK